MSTPPSLADLRAAAARIAPHIHRTPVLTSRTIDQMLGASVYFKCENLQRTGAFKLRGACNAVLSLTDSEAARGVATHSSGNHGAALAYAARLRGLEARVVMPEGASRAKQAAVREYGGHIEPCGASLDERDQVLHGIVAETGATIIHPYNDPRIIAGQGTCALELIEDLPPLDAVVAPVGGGGLISGIAVAVSALSPQTRVIGAEPAGADDAWQSLRAGRLMAGAPPQTIADGLRASLGDLTFAVIHDTVDEILRVSEPGIVSAMRLLWERMKLVVEPSASVPIAALLEHGAAFHGQRIAVVVSGGNVDLDALPWGRPD